MLGGMRQKPRDFKHHSKNIIDTWQFSAIHGYLENIDEYFAQRSQG